MSDADNLARKRWKLLAAAILGGEADFSGSVREFSSYNLVRFCRKKEDHRRDGEDIWKTAYISGMANVPSLRIRSPDNQKIGIDQLVGFNNTGNVCIWPSEEVAAYWCAKHAGLFEGKTVLELGAGSTGLASIFIAAVSRPRAVVLTDGNELAVENLHAIIYANQKTFAHCGPVVPRRHRWGFYADSMFSPDDALLARTIFGEGFDPESHTDYAKSCRLEACFDVIIANDCFFFDGDRGHLVESVLRYLKVGGHGYFWAPTRDGTLQKFIHRLQKLAKTLEIQVSINVRRDYDAVVSRAAKDMGSNSSKVFIPELHYPLMVEAVRWS